MASAPFPSLMHWVARPAPPVRVRLRPMGAFCAHCWGAGKIQELGPLGWMPVRCGECFGTRRVL